MRATLLRLVTAVESEPLLRGPKSGSQELIDALQAAKLLAYTSFELRDDVRRLRVENEQLHTDRQHLRSLLLDQSEAFVAAVNQLEIERDRYRAMLNGPLQR